MYLLIIGADSSGQDNHFHDEDFVVGNTSKVWSNTGTITNPAGSAIDADHPAYPIQRLYDQNLTIGWGADAGVVKSQKGLSIPFTSSVRMRVMTAGGDGAYVTVFGSGGTSATVNATDLTVSANTEETVGFTGLTSPITGLEFKGATGFYLFWFEVDGKKLYDGNLADTVKDTPMLNYAVLELSSFSNGAGLTTVIF